jgi:hypothetical protein
MEDVVAERVVERFDVRFMDVGWPKGPVGGAKQMIPVVTEEPWFDPGVLAPLVFDSRYGRSGLECPVCGVWKWWPIQDVWPQVMLSVGEDRPVIGSPEWFGGGGRAFHELLMVRELAELLCELSPRNLWIRDDADIKYV